MMGAQNARTLVKNQCRQNTTNSVFFVRIHVCRTIAPAILSPFCPGGRVVWSEYRVAFASRESQSGVVVYVYYRSIANISTVTTNTQTAKEGENISAEAKRRG